MAGYVERVERVALAVSCLLGGSLPHPAPCPLCAASCRRGAGSRSAGIQTILPGPGWAGEQPLLIAACLSPLMRVCCTCLAQPPCCTPLGLSLPLQVCPATHLLSPLLFKAPARPPSLPPSLSGPCRGGHHGAAAACLATGGAGAPRLFTAAPAGVRPECHVPQHFTARVCVVHPPGRRLQQP